MGGEDPLEEGIVMHSSILAWRIAWIGELGGLQSMGLQRVGEDLVTKQQQHNSSNQKTKKETITFIVAIKL